MCGVKVYLDPDLDYKTYPNILQEFEVMQAWEMDEEKKINDEQRKRLIVKKLGDVIDTSFIYNNYDDDAPAN